jgi:exodeoxyribonuclease-1
MNTIYWYDYETFGIDPRYDRIAQFAGLRTDEDLNVIGDPLVLYCQPADDVLPDPKSCLITGITPQKALADGVAEYEFIAAIHKEFATANTCIAGFNNIRFDDEFTRFCLYRNFYNAYAHEWQNHNSRWDIIDMVRLTRALRPEGIVWPTGDDGRPSIRLELLTRANGIAHEAAHDAMSDVYATIAVARLIREKQPRLYEYVYSNRKKDAAGKLLNLRTHDAVLHVSSKYSTERNSIAMVMPICRHPVNKNGVVVYDLATDPAQYIEADADEVAGSIFTPAAELPDEVERIPLKVVHLNKCPVIVPLKTMDAAAARRLDINIASCLANRDTLLKHIDELADKTIRVFGHQDYPEVTDIDAQLYSGGFFSNADYDRMQRIRETAAEQLAGLALTFDDARLDEMLFRYRARNFPQTLSTDERRLWLEFKQQKLTDVAQTTRTINQVVAEIEVLRKSDEITGRELAILDEIMDYIENSLIP